MLPHARIATRKTDSGRHTVTVELDGGPRRIRNPGFPSAAAARAAGVTLAHGLGRTVVASIAGAAMLIAGAAIPRTSDTRAGDTAPALSRSA